MFGGHSYRRIITAQLHEKTKRLRCSHDTCSNAKHGGVVPKSTLADIFLVPSFHVTLLRAPRGYADAAAPATAVAAIALNHGTLIDEPL